MLSKSRYLKGLKCQKALWLHKFKKEEAFYPEATLQVFATGNIAGDLAQQYFPGGTLALVDEYPNYKAIERTKELIANGVTTIYEATFAAESTLVALDILHKIDGKWHAFEVKSTNSAKNEHIRDAAIQYFVMTNAGIEIEDISIMYFDNTYIKQGAIIPTELFTYESVFDRMQVYLEDIPANIETFLEVYKNDEPEVLIGNHCDKPYGCEFANYCHSLNENQSIIAAWELAPKLSTDIHDKNTEALQEFLIENPYPIYSLDFESIQHGIPKYDNSRPYQQIPFQYSLHYQKDIKSAPVHFEFLGNGKDDPREALIKQMIKDLNYNNIDGKILMYSHFEKTMIKTFIRDFPKYTEELEKISGRLIDLAAPYRKHIQTEATQNTWTLKVVLPTFLPHLSYNDLEIKNGTETMAVYRNLPEIKDVEEINTLRENMLAYCKLDTKAVLDLYNLLPKISETKNCLACTHFFKFGMVLSSGTDVGYCMRIQNDDENYPPKYNENGTKLAKSIAIKKNADTCDAFEIGS